MKIKKTGHAEGGIEFFQYITARNFLTIRTAFVTGDVFETDIWGQSGWSFVGRSSASDAESAARLTAAVFE